MRQRPLLLALLALLLLAPCLPGRGLAQAVVAPEVAAEAAARFDRGVELYSEGSLDAALVQFERAFELVPNYRVLYNIAQVQAERHEYVAAIGLFERYVTEGGVELPEARRAEAREQIAKLSERVARLSVETDVPDAQLFVDDELMGSLPLARPVLIDSGVRSVRVEAPGFGPAVRKIKVAGGDQPRLSMPVRALASATPSDAGAVPSPGPRVPSYRPLWIASAGTLALGAATLTFGLLTKGASRALDDELDRYPGSAAGIRADRTRVKTYAALTDGMAAATLVSLGVAVYFLIDPPTAPLGRRERAVHRTLRMLARAGGLGLHGRF